MKTRILELYEYTKKLSLNTDYWYSKTSRNNIFLVMTNIFFLIWVSFSLYYNYNSTILSPVSLNYYTALSILYYIIFALYVSIIHIKVKIPKHKVRIQLLISFTFLIWTSIYSAIDVSTGIPPFIFILYMISTATSLRINMLLHSLFNVIAYTMYAIICYSVVQYTRENLFFIMIPSCVAILSSIMIITNNISSYKRYVTLQLVSDQKEKFKYHAHTDYLTKIPNRKSIMEYFEEQMENKEQTLSCIFVDIDNFKKFNDTNGHVMGDSCLRRVANMLHDVVEKENGMVGRYGGEEFLIVIPNTNHDETVRITEALIKRVNDEKLKFTTYVGDKRVTISAGIFIREKNNDISLDHAISNADAALYEAKRNGKMGYRIFNENTTMKFAI